MAQTPGRSPLRQELAAVITGGEKKIQPIPIPQRRRKRWSLELGIRDEGDQHHEQKGQENQKPFHSDDQLIHLTFFLDHREKFFRRERRAASGA
jgi:hypothetical protein